MATTEKDIGKMERLYRDFAPQPKRAAPSASAYRDSYTRLPWVLTIGPRIRKSVTGFFSKLRPSDLSSHTDPLAKKALRRIK